MMGKEKEHKRDAGVLENDSAHPRLLIYKPSLSMLELGCCI